MYEEVSRGKLLTTVQDCPEARQVKHAHTAGGGKAEGQQRQAKVWDLYPASDDPAPAETPMGFSLA